MQKKFNERYFRKDSGNGYHKYLQGDSLDPSTQFTP